MVLIMYINSQKKYKNIAIVILLFIILNIVGGGAFAQYNAFEDPGSVQKGSTSGPNLVAENERVEAGKINIGSTAYVVMLFENDGSAPVNVTGVKLYPSSEVNAEVSLNQCAKKPVKPLEKCAITIAVTPMQGGVYTVGVLVGHSGRTGLVKAVVNGSAEVSEDISEGVVQGDVEAIPENINFGTANVGQTLVQSITLRNKTSNSIDIRSIRLEAASQSGLAINEECPEKLEAGEGCTVLVTWLPQLKGKSQGVLIVEHSAAPNIVQIKISGEFSPTEISSATIYPDSVANMGILVSDRETVDFGSGVNNRVALTVSLVNTGDKALDIYDIRLSGTDGGVTLSKSGCKAGVRLKPIEACPLIVNWTPNREGELLDDILIRHSGARGMLVLPIRGTANKVVDRGSTTMTITQQNGPDGDIDEDINIDIVSDTMPVLDSYVVTSLALDRAIITSPTGIQLVKNGQQTVLAGASWNVKIVTNGVELAGKNGKVLLVFDKSLSGFTNTSSGYNTDSSGGSNSGSGSGIGDSSNITIAPSID